MVHLLQYLVFFAASGRSDFYQKMSIERLCYYRFSFHQEILNPNQAGINAAEECLQWNSTICSEQGGADHPSGNWWISKDAWIMQKFITNNELCLWTCSEQTSELWQITWEQIIKKPKKQWEIGIFSIKFPLDNFWFTLNQISKPLKKKKNHKIT